MSSLQPAGAPRVAVYARTSSDEQAENETIEVQREFLHRYCELHGLEVAGEYLDDGVTGTIPLAKRPHGARLLHDAKAGTFGGVLFYRVSRLGRRLAVALDAYERLDAAGVIVKSATEPIDTSTPIGRFIFQMLGSFAELDRETIIDNTTRGRARGAKNGRWYGVVPTGYAVHDGKHVPNEVEILPGLAEAELVRDVFRRIAEGGSSIKVAAYVSALGVGRFKRYAKHDGREVVLPGRGGWSPKRVSEMVRNPTYKGTHVYNGRHGDIVREVPALVSEELWQRANDQLAQNRSLAKRRGKREYLLRTLIRCEACGVAYKGECSKGYRFYRCAYFRPNLHADPAKRCRSKSVSADAIERAVWADVERFLREPGRALDEARADLAERHGRAADVAGERRALMAELARKDRERGDILALLRRGTITLAEAEWQLGDIAAQQAAAQAEIDRLAGRQALYDADAQRVRTAEALLADLRARLDAGLDDATRQAVVRALVRKITIRTEGEGRTRSATALVDYAFDAPVGFAIGSSRTGAGSGSRPRGGA